MKRPDRYRIPLATCWLLTAFTGCRAAVPPETASNVRTTIASDRTVVEALEQSWTELEVLFTYLNGQYPEGTWQEDGSRADPGEEPQTQAQTLFGRLTRHARSISEVRNPAVHPMLGRIRLLHWRGGASVQTLNLSGTAGADSTRLFWSLLDALVRQTVEACPEERYGRPGDDDGCSVASELLPPIDSAHNAARALDFLLDAHTSLLEFMHRSDAPVVEVEYPLRAPVEFAPPVEVDRYSMQQPEPPPRFFANAVTSRAAHLSALRAAMDLCSTIVSLSSMESPAERCWAARTSATQVWNRHHADLSGSGWDSPLRNAVWRARVASAFADDSEAYEASILVGRGSEGLFADGVERSREAWRECSIYRLEAPSRRSRELELR